MVLGIERGLAPDFFFELAVPGLALVEAVAEPVLAFPGDESRADSGRRIVLVFHGELVALLDRPAVTRLAPLISERAVGAGDPAIGLGAVQSHEVERPVRRHLDCAPVGCDARAGNEGGHNESRPEPVPHLAIHSSTRPASHSAEAGATTGCGRARGPRVAGHAGRGPFAGARRRSICSSRNRAGGTGDGA